MHLLGQALHGHLPRPGPLAISLHLVPGGRGHIGSRSPLLFLQRPPLCLLDPKGAQAPRELSAASGDIPRVTPGELLLEQWVETTVVVSSPHAQDGPWVRSTGAEMPRRIPPGPLVPPWAGAGAGRDVSSHLDFLYISVFYPKNALSL